MPEAKLPASLVVGYYLLAVVLVLLDQYTKHLAVAVLSEHGSIYVGPYLNWTLSFNTGAAFSMLSQFGGWQRWFLSGISLLVSIVLIGWLPQQSRHLSALAITLILGGAIGNLVDRLTTGQVIDFISLHYETYYFAIFNLADSCISLGAVLLLLDWWRPGLRTHVENRA